MKIFILLLFIMTALFSDTYYSKVEPYKLKKISSNVNGLVLLADEDMIGKKLSKKVYVKIDSMLDVDELDAIEEKFIYFKNTMKLDKKILKNLDSLLSKKRKNYAKIKNLTIKSDTEKDREFYDLMSSQNLYLSTQKEIDTLKIKVVDLRFRESQLIKTIEDKHFRAKGFVLYSLNVKEGQVVSKSMQIATLADVSKAILTIYLNENDAIDAKNKIIYLDGKKTSYKIDRLLNIADSKNISKYKAQIIIKPPKLFSKLVKIELKSANSAK